MRRRDFLKAAPVAAAGALGFPDIVEASALGLDGAVPPSERIVMAGVGFGMQGPPNMRSFLENRDVQWVAVCDVDRGHLEEARRTVDEHYGRRSCAVYRDFRELFAKPGLEAVAIAVPDHWHAMVALSAVRAGLDVYGEKPLTHGLREGRALCDAVRRFGRVWQTGSWQRSVADFHHAAELVRNGRLGRILRVEVGLPRGHYDFAGTFGREAVAPPPPDLDYDLWVGPARWFPYREAAVHMNWRWTMAFGGGQLMDWVGHHVDIAHWGLGFEGTGPVSVRAVGEYAEGGIYDSAVRYRVDALYADGTPLVVAGGHADVWPGTKWIGERGWIWVDRGAFRTEPASLWREVVGPGEVRLKRSRDHYRDFLDCVRSRAETIAPCETAHRSASVGHLGVTALGTGRELRWDPAAERIIGDDGAERFLTRTYRAPWRLPV